MCACDFPANPETGGLPGQGNAPMGRSYFHPRHLNVRSSTNQTRRRFSAWHAPTAACQHLGLQKHANRSVSTPRVYVYLTSKTRTVSDYPATHSTASRATSRRPRTPSAKTCPTVSRRLPVNHRVVVRVSTHGDFTACLRSRVYVAQQRVSDYR